MRTEASSRTLLIEIARRLAGLRTGTHPYHTPILVAPQREAASEIFLVGKMCAYLLTPYDKRQTAEKPNT
jgi:hypothetical protein